MRNLSPGIECCLQNNGDDFDCDYIPDLLPAEICGLGIGFRSGRLQLPLPSPDMTLQEVSFWQC
jgi:hypothetical protein